MKFGKLESVDNLQLVLPADHPSTKLVLKDLKNEGSNAQLFLGSTSWNVSAWKNKIYPAKAKSADFLSHYSNYFNSIELNTTYYRIPKVEQVLKWKDQFSKGFKFCPKVLQYISRARDLGVSKGRINEFLNGVSVFEEKLGPCFLQLPPYFSFDRLDILEEFLKLFSSNVQLCIELRHESFYESNDQFEKLLELMYKYDRSLVITDVAGRRDVLHMALTSDLVMIRFGGNDLHPTDYERANDWAKRLREWFVSGMKGIYFFVHQKDGLLSPDFSSYLAQHLENQLGSNGFDQIRDQLTRLKINE